MEAVGGRSQNAFDDAIIGISDGSSGLRGEDVTTDKNVRVAGNESTPVPPVAYPIPIPQ